MCIRDSVRNAVQAFALSTEPIDRGWYDELSRVSAVAADIAGVASTHINHLTPRVLDIDDLYARMTALGVAMIDAIQGPPHTKGPAVLLRQTSFRALSEPRRFRDAQGGISDGTLRVRFGEVEAPSWDRRLGPIVGMLGPLVIGLGAGLDHRFGWSRVPASVQWAAALALVAVAGVLAALAGGVGAAVGLSIAVNMASAVARMAFESIVQRSAPDANQGRAFAKFETRFQLSWVLSGVLPTLFTMPGWVGFLIVGVAGAVGLVAYLAGGFGVLRARAGLPTIQELRTRRGSAARQAGTAVRPSDARPPDRRPRR